MTSVRGRPRLDTLRADFECLRDPVLGKNRIKEKLHQKEAELEKYLTPWFSLSKEADHIYPSQGLLRTPFDFLGNYDLQMLPQEFLVKTLRVRHFFLELFNHPYRIHFLDKTTKQKTKRLPKVRFKALSEAMRDGVSLAVGDIGAAVVGDLTKRISRRDRYASGPFVKLGRRARIPFTGSASPDVWNCSAAIATMAASQALATIPRNGLMSDPKRQADLAKEVFLWLETMASEVLNGRGDKQKVLNYWKGNVMGTLEASVEKALLRSEMLYAAGVRVFRVYSPEPGTGVVEVVKALRKKWGDEIEIFSGQIVSVRQAKQVEDAGADGIYVGIGGGGRCITGIRSGSVIDWPDLVFALRGEIRIPVVVEGGASDNIATALLLGATGISTSRVVSGGTIESPGGSLYCVNDGGKLFKPYGGEASARAKYLDKKLLPFDIPAFVEGETTRAMMSYVKYVYPTLTYNLHILLEDAILTMVFRGAENISSLHKIDPSPLRQISKMGDFQRNTH